MSRRVANPAADRAAQNQNTIKSLLKLEGNKTCADCKRNKHPRWASWNLGIFVCIRCSGIHRGMGTHISRIKSVDLDAWTDEQLQSVLKWGNTRANKSVSCVYDRYWEAKLAPGHVPSEAKIENFIRTKYDSKRWVMDGPMPDPSTLDVDGDDDVPLNIVQEKAKLERSASQRTSSTSSQTVAPPRRAPQPNIDLFGDDTPSPPVRPSTTDVTGIRAPPKEQPPPKQNKPADSLLGLDFFGTPQPASNRPSTGSVNSFGSSGQSRPDLKQSILSLYASAPKPQPAQPQEHSRSPSYGGMPSPTAQTQSSSFGGLNDAFSGLSFASPPAQQQPKPSPFTDLTSFSATKSPPAPTQFSSPPPLTGGSFFDPPAQQSAPKPTQTTKPSNGLNFSFTNPLSTSKPSPALPTTSFSASNDLFDLAPSPAPPSPPPPSKVSSPPVIQQQSFSSPFNLSSQPPKPTPSSNPTRPPITSTSSASMFSGNVDAWGSTDAWSTPDPPSQPSQPSKPSMQAMSPPKATATSPNRGGFDQNDFGGWGAPVQPSINTTTKPPATVSADEDFGGWNSAGPVTPGTGMGFGSPAATTKQNTNTSSKPGGFGGGGDDLFSNVWE